MLFNSPLFLFVFFPCLYFIYRLSPTTWQNRILLGASLFFYSWAEPIFVFWALGSALLDWALGEVISRSTEPTVRKGALTLGVIANVALLAYFKYANFFWANFVSILKQFGLQSFSLLHVALPIAISFIVFEKITYLVDLYRKDGRPAADLLTYMLYVFYFPKLLAGPIIRYRDIDQQLRQRGVTWIDFRDGMIRFLFGLAKKVLLADHIGHLANEVFALPAKQLDMPFAWLGVLCFSAQIYFDFSGYSDMAIGLSQIFGFRLKENFRQPYTAINFTDFWRRWHISLSTWIRDYLYIPLGGNRVSLARTYFNLCLCFFLSGLWHGAAWTFIIWGLFHGTMLVADRVFWKQWQTHLPKVINVAITFLLVMISWVIFRSQSLDQIGFYLRAMFIPQSVEPTLLSVSPDIVWTLAAAYFIIFLPLLPRFEKVLAWYENLALRRTFELAGAYGLLLFALARIATFSYQSFLYFRF
ncbi:MAG: MBOAT family protein [Verrucomicrobia bacterium]|nr:MBOAT family protein [Verrucomicrobiota bacterium]MBV8485987.1 MBOAT family protein [Verrucomicrobiota bacterium]